MAPRKRLKKNKELVSNLYASTVNGRTYYRYRRPDTGEYRGLGTDRAAAIAAARQLNGILAVETDLVRSVLGTTDQTVSHLIGRFRKELLPTKGFADSTKRIYEYRLGRIDRDLGNRAIEAMGVRDVSDYLDSNFERDAYIKHRSTLIELFRFAIMKGLYPSDSGNPAEITYAKTDYGKSRKRMTLDQFRAIHALAQPWMQIAMELALITLQGRAEIINMKFADLNDGILRVVRQKTQAHEHAYLAIQSTNQLESILARARRTGIASPYIVHRAPDRRISSTEKDHWTQLTPNHFTSEFRKVRDKTTLFDRTDRLTRPTFHEIRSLGSWLYEKQGFDTASYIQPLMAHADEKMTKLYQSGHERKWVTVQAGLDIQSVLYKR